MRTKIITLIAACCLVLSGCSGLTAPHTQMLGLRGPVSKAEFRLDTMTTHRLDDAPKPMQIEDFDKIFGHDKRCIFSFNKAGYATKLELPGPKISIKAQYDRKNRPQKISMSRGSILLVGQILFKYHWLSGRLRSIEVCEGADNILLGVTMERKSSSDTTTLNLSDDKGKVQGALLLTHTDQGEIQSISIVLRNKIMGAITLAYTSTGALSGFEIGEGDGRPPLMETNLKYSPDGLVQQLTTRTKGKEAYHATYTSYNEHKDPTAARFEMDGDTLKTTYKYLYDPQGNWTKLSCELTADTTDDADTTADTYPKSIILTISRKIEYYKNER